jgi:2-isopropylmalate synthase
MYDWNTAQVPRWRGAHPVKVVDESLRDGLQNATAVDPSVDKKITMLEHMRRVGVDVVSVGLPAASPRSLAEAVALVEAIRDRKLDLLPTGAARTVARDVAAVAEVAQRTGVAVEVYAFIGSSPIRHYAESWDLDFLLRHVGEATDTARREGLSFCLVTEDTTRARPDVLGELFRCALAGGARRLCLCDTVGHCTPDGVARLVRFTRDVLTAAGRPDVGLDWHAHNDRGLALQTALWASELGVDRIHATALGIGERVGNVPVELLLLNLGLLGSKPAVALEALEAYCVLAAEALGIGGLPDTHPLFGRATRARVGGAPMHAIHAMPAAPPPARALPIVRPRRVLVPLSLSVNGRRLELAVPPNRTLLELLRYDLDLYGSKQGCDKGDCGACTVRIDGAPRLSCITLALDCEGSEVLTVEALPGAEELHPLLDAFDRTGAAQCGFCTPGFLMTAWALLDENKSPTRDEIKQAIASNLCRCTGYKSIVDAIELAAAMMRGDEERMLGMPGREHVPPPITGPEIGRS